MGYVRLSPKDTYSDPPLSNWQINISSNVKIKKMEEIYDPIAEIYMYYLEVDVSKLNQNLGRIPGTPYLFNGRCRQTPCSHHEKK